MNMCSPVSGTLHKSLVQAGPTWEPITVQFEIYMRNACFRSKFRIPYYHATREKRMHDLIPNCTVGKSESGMDEKIIWNHITSYFCGLANEPLMLFVSFFFLFAYLHCIATLFVLITYMIYSWKKYLSGRKHKHKHISLFPPKM